MGSVIARHLTQTYQQIFTCPMSTMETLEKGVKYVQRHQNEVVDVALVLLLLTLNIFHTFCSVFIGNFEHVFFCLDIVGTLHGFI